MNVVSFTTGKSRQLGGRVAPEESVTETAVTDAPKLAKLLTRIVRELAVLRRRFYPKRTDFEDLPLPAGGDTVTITHKFGGRVRWWVVDQQGDIPELTKDTEKTTADDLVLVSDVECVATIRVEEAG